MKWIRYNFGTDENQMEKAMEYSEANLAIAQAEACSGQYVIEDDGLDKNYTPTAEERIQTIEQFINKLREAFPTLAN